VKKALSGKKHTKCYGNQKYAFSIDNNATCKHGPKAHFDNITNNYSVFLLLHSIPQKLLE